MPAPPAEPQNLAACIFVHYLYLSTLFQFWSGIVPDIEFIRGEIERMRIQVGRQRREILQLQRAGIPTMSAETLLQRMLDKIDDLCATRDKLKAQQPGHNEGKVLGGRQW
jgi:hypothetical protein